jgi:hypothetical protein
MKPPTKPTIYILVKVGCFVLPQTISLLNHDSTWFQLIIDNMADKANTNRTKEQNRERQRRHREKKRLREQEQSRLLGTTAFPIDPLRTSILTKRKSPRPMATEADIDGSGIEIVERRLW